MANRLPCDESTLRAWLVRYITSVLNLPGDSVPTDQSFDSYGFDSIEVVVMAGVLEEEFSVQVDPVQLFEHPSIDDFAKHCARDVDAPSTGVSGMP
jgi:acyl carrier protein